MSIKILKKQVCRDECGGFSIGNKDGFSASACGSAGECCCKDQEISGIDNNSNIAFYIDGLDCADCAASLENAVNRIKGVSAKINFSSAKLKATYDKSITGPKEIIKIIAGFGYKATPEKETDDEPVFLRTVFRISGLDCADCADKLEKKISAMPGVVAATVNFGAGKITVEHSINDSVIRQEIRHAGYDAEQEKAGSPDNSHRWWINVKTQATIVSGILLAIAAILDWAGVNGHIAVSLYILTAIIGGYHAAKSGFYGLRFLSLDMNVLMTIAIIGAMAIGEWSEGAVVAFLFSLGNALQTYTMDKTRHSIRLLMELAPPDALVRKYGTEQRMPVKDIAKGDIIIVKPGERIAMDGIVHSGSSSVNQSAITGESIPVEKSVGDMVYSGTVNENGALEIEVTRMASDSTLAKITHLVEEAQAQRAPSQQFVDKFAKYYTPAVILTAAGVMILPWLFFKEPFDPWFYKGLVLLVISCPCALVISTPVSIVSAIGNASRQGVLIKGGAYLEQMGAIRAIAFDKTGTLTIGRPRVTDVVIWTDNYSETDFLSLAAAIEKFSEHPLAQAILEKANGLELKQVTDFMSIPGRGAQAVIDEQNIFIGNTRLFEEIGHDLARYEANLSNFELQGKTVMLMGTKDTIFGMIAAADIMRENSIEAVRALRTAGMKHISMLTGDNPRVAGVIAEKLGIEIFYSSLLPEDKAAAVKKIATEYGNIAMVGEGVNDAPALASATVGIAMGMSGSDMALETADIALMADDLHKLSYVVRLSRKTVAVIKQNIGFSVLVKFIFIILTFTGNANLWLAVAADAGASIIVTLNGMRLMRNLRQRSLIGNKT